MNLDAMRRLFPGRSAARGGALQNRDPGSSLATGIPHLRCIAAALHRVREMSEV